MTNAQRIAEFRAASFRFVVAITGGGSAFISDYLAIPGASSSLIEALVPYSRNATDAFLGKAPESYCSETTSRLIASAAFARARALEPDVDPDALLGIGATASLVADRPKKGKRRAFCAVLSRRGVFSASLGLAERARSRGEEERVVADFILLTALFAARKLRNPDDATWREFSEPSSVDSAVAPTSEDAASISWTLLDPEGADFLYGRGDGAPSKLRALRWTDGRLDRALVAGGASLVVDDSLESALATPVASDDATANERRAIFPGSFNPPHDGHAQIVAAARRRLETDLTLEISARNVDKPPLDALELLRRVRALGEKFPGESVWISNAARFAEKAELAPNSTFVVGADTILRLGDPRYEDGSVDQRDAVVARLAALNVRFLVFSRTRDGRAASPDELKRRIPAALADLCDFAPDPIVEVSSTELRAQNRRPSDS